MGELGPTWSLEFSMCGRAGSHYNYFQTYVMKILNGKGKVAVCCHI